jgi:hypothetical protein
MRSGLPHLLLDAANIIHADSELAALHRRDPAAAEDALHLLVCQLPGQTKVLCIHDGGVPGRTLRRGIDVRRTGDQSADDEIIRWLKHHPAARATVVTDDRELTRRSRTLGAQTAPARGFCAAPRRRREGLAARPGDEPLPAHEVDHWLRTFGLDG